VKKPAPHGNHRLQWTLVAAVVLITMVLALLVIFTRPAVKKQEVATPVMPVDILVVSAASEPASMQAFGTVEARREVSLKPEVTGKIIEVNPEMIEGGILEEGQVMLRIDPRDFAAIVAQERATLERAQFELRVEEGRQVIADREWELLGDDLKRNELAKELALRKPHLKEKKAAVLGAQSRLDKALIDLQRTVLDAPFDAMVLSEDVEIGQLVTPQTTVARLVATEQFQVRVSIPYDKLRWLRLPHGDEIGSSVTVSRELGEGRRVEWKGHILKLLGDVDPQGRLARVLVAVPDPLQLDLPPEQRQPLLLGSYVRVDLKGPTLEDVFVLPRQALREEQVVWIMDENNALEIRPVHIVLNRQDDVVIDEGLADGDRVITSPLPVALPGIKLSIAEEESPKDAP